MNLSASVFTLHMTLLLLGNLFWYRSLKYGLVK